MLRIQCIGKAESSLSQALSQAYPLSWESSPTEEWTGAYLLDMSCAAPEDAGWAERAKKEGRPVVLLNMPEKTEIKGCFLTVPSKAAVVFFEENYMILRLLDVKSSLKTSEKSSMGVDFSSHTFTEPEVVESGDGETYSLTEEELVQRLITAISPEEMDCLRDEVRSAADLHDVEVLPSPQYKVTYVYYDLSADIPNVGQTWKNAAICEYALYGSAEPQGEKKYLRVALIPSHGSNETAYSVTNMRWDNSSDRGYFINEVSYSVETGDSGLTCRETAPQGSGSGSGSTSCSYSQKVYVDTSKFPYYDASYNIGRSQTFDASGFRYNGTVSQSRAALKYKLSDTWNSDWDIFASNFWTGADVKSIPALAKSTFRPLLYTLFEADGTKSGCVNISNRSYLEVMHAWRSWKFFYAEESLYRYRYESVSLDAYVNFNNVTC